MDFFANKYGGFQWNGLSISCISLPTGTNDKPLTAIGKFSTAVGKLMIGKTLAINGEEITNAMIGKNVLAFYW